jgi:hypothetical protein
VSDLHAPAPPERSPAAVGASVPRAQRTQIASAFARFFTPTLKPSEASAVIESGDARIAGSVRAAASSFLVGRTVPERSEVASYGSTVRRLSTCCLVLAVFQRTPARAWCGAYGDLRDGAGGKLWPRAGREADQGARNGDFIRGRPRFQWPGQPAASEAATPGSRRRRTGRRRPRSQESWPRRRCRRRRCPLCRARSR